MRLSELIPGAPFVVSKVLVGGEIGKRLADMGFTDGATGILVRGAFMHGPLQVQIRGYDLLIRRGEAKLIDVAKRGADEIGGMGASGSVAALGTADTVGAVGAVGASGAGAAMSAEASGRAAGATAAASKTDRAGVPYRGHRSPSGLIRSLFAQQDCCGAYQRSDVHQRSDDYLSSGARPYDDARKGSDAREAATDRKAAR